jgi:hypothetical protein
MIRFGKDRGSSPSAADRRPPPDYFSRRVQLKILLLVFMFLGVLMLMSEARDPANWRWMWNLQGSASHSAPNQQRQAEAGGRAGDPRGGAPPASPATAPLPTNAGTGGEMTEPTVRADSSGQEVALGIVKGGSTATIQRDGWSFVLRRLSKEQRELLQQGLWHWRHGRSFSAAQRSRWIKLVERLDEIWSEYHRRAERLFRDESQQLTKEQTNTGIETIVASRELWQQRRDALTVLAQPAPLSSDQASVLAGLQQVLDAWALAQIEDSTVLRNSETAAWYRLWDKLQSLGFEELAEEAEPVNYVQLYSQPREFRGELVQVTGTVGWGYRVTSQETRFGIDGYTVLGIQPQGGGDSPLVLYCVDLPSGFPSVSSSKSQGRGVPLRVEVEASGYFFKRWLHRTRGGMHVSPLILGTVTRWRDLDTIGQDEAAVPLPKGTILLASLAMALLAILVAVLVYRSSRWSSWKETRSTRPPHHLPSFDEEQARGNVQQSLREFADDQSAE